MGWIETAGDGREIKHHDQLTSPDGTLTVPGNAIDWWLNNGGVGAPMRTSCTCGWTNPAPGPQLPPLPPPAQPVSEAERTVFFLSAKGSDLGILPWWWIGDWEPGPQLAAWKEYHLRTWQTHIAAVLPGTNADDPEIHALRRVAALLDDVDQHPFAVLAKLHRVAAAVDGARDLAATAVVQAGDARLIPHLPHLLGMTDEQIQQKYGTEPGETQPA